MADREDIGKLVLAFFAGSVVGAALGLLFAPSSGTETRQKIKEKSLDVKDLALEKMDTVKSGAGRLVERGKDRVTDLKSQVQAAVEAGKEAYKEKKSELKQESEEA